MFTDDLKSIETLHDALLFRLVQSSSIPPTSNSPPPS